MKTPIALYAAASLMATLSACAGLPNAPPSNPTLASGQIATAVARSTEQGGRFIALVGPRRQHAEPFLGVPGTNFYALRSMIDTRTGETSHQLFVADSYFGAERNWEAARDGRGQLLRFIPISKNEITCDNGCSYAEEFAAALPENLLRTSPQGLPVGFTAKSGAQQTISVPGDLVANQLAAVAEARTGLPTAAATPCRPPARPADQGQPAATPCSARSYLRAGVLIGSASGAAPNEAAIREAGGSP
jgi:hypothetical protein